MNIKNLSLAFLLTCCSSQNKLTLEEVKEMIEKKSPAKKTTIKKAPAKKTVAKKK